MNGQGPVGVQIVTPAGVWILAPTGARAQFPAAALLPALPARLLGPRRGGSAAAGIMAG